MKGTLLTAVGTFFVGLGILGLFLPILPTTPFLLLAAACYARSSRRFYHWLLNAKYLGEYIRNYRERRGLALQTKVMALLFLWAGIAYSVLAVEILVAKIVLLVVAIGVTLHLATFPTLSK